MSSLIESIKNQAQNMKKTIVLPEGEEIRVLKAADRTLKEKIAKLILLGNKEKIAKIANINKLKIDDSDIKILDYMDTNQPQYDELVSSLYELKKSKGCTKNRAIELLKNPLYYGVMLVKSGMADGMVGGCTYPTADVLRAAFKILTDVEDKKFASSFFMVQTQNKNLGENGVLFFADCAVNPNPTDRQLAQIAIDTANSFKMFVKKEPRVAMLSYSTKLSAKGEMVEKVISATKIAKELDSNLKIDGEIQLDAAIIPKVSKLKAPESEIAGLANVLIFPNLEAGNIGYKLVERFGNAKVFGPIMQGITPPVNDLSRGCDSEDILGGIAITVVQAESSLK